MLLWRGSQCFRQILLLGKDLKEKVSCPPLGWQSYVHLYEQFLCVGCALLFASKEG